MLGENNTGWLFKKNKLGKILVWNASNKGHMFNDILIIHGQQNGRLQRETIPIVPKAGRGLLEQFELEVTSLYNKQKDKGYKSEKDLGIIIAAHEEGDSYYASNIEGDKRKWGTMIEAVTALLPDDLTDAQGTLKPMKCTPYEGSAIKKVKFSCYAQPKLDGVRCFISYDGEKWNATSSSGKSYNVAAREILRQVDNFAQNISLILDGELYIHGIPLQTISGWCRKQTSIAEQEKLEFHIFDVIDLDNKEDTFESRVDFIFSLHNVLEEEHPNIKPVETHKLLREEQIKTFHDHFVEKGYEGLIIRNKDLGYEFGRRSTSIFKLKDFKDEEFKIIGIELGKRGSEDMVFICETKETKQFKANPIGNREQKEYWSNHHSSWKGKLGTVRYLTRSINGLPQGNPVLKVIRDYE